MRRINRYKPPRKVKLRSESPNRNKKGKSPVTFINAAQKPWMKADKQYFLDHPEACEYSRTPYPDEKEFFEREQNAQAFLDRSDRIYRCVKILVKLVKRCEGIDMLRTRQPIFEVWGVKNR